jgi:hypothetical protein
MVAPVPDAPYPAAWSTHHVTQPMMLYNENVGTAKNSLVGMIPEREKQAC